MSVLSVVACSEHKQRTVEQASATYFTTKRLKRFIMDKKVRYAMGTRTA